MNVESRMDEFEKVSHKTTKQDVKERMGEFDPVDKVQKQLTKEKSSTLPYSLKRYKTCPHCGEFMEKKQKRLIFAKAVNKERL